jgi:hypothetical protein
MRTPEAQERWDRVQAAVNKIKQLPGVRDAHIDDSNMDDTGFNVDVTYQLKLDNAYDAYAPFHFSFGNLRGIVQKINAILRKEGLRANSIQQPKLMYNRYYYKKFNQGYDRSWGRFDVYCY